MSSALEIARVLRADILEGTFSPEEELRQVELATRFDVSRMPVRDALNVLARDRLITLTPNRGGKVISLSPEELDEVYDLRSILEADALERAFGAMDQEARKRITLEMKRCEVDADTPGFPQADFRFHVALYAPAQRPRQLALIGELRDLCQIHVAAYAGLQSFSARWSEDHRRIVAAIEQGRCRDAVSALKAHLGEARSQLQALMAKGGKG